MIEYRSSNGKKIRERVGTNRNEAEQRLVEVRHPKNRGMVQIESKISINQLFDWYLELPVVKAKAAYRRVQAQTKALRRLLDGQNKVSNLTIRQLELYVAQRTSEGSPTKQGECIAPKTCKEELNLLRAMINKAVDQQMLDQVPVKGNQYPEIQIDNVRQRIFTEQELAEILQASPIWLRRIITMAQGTGMRQNEIIQLKWDSVVLDRGFVRLKAKETKTRQARSVKLVPNVIEMLQEIPRETHTRKVFLSSTKKPIPYWTAYCHDTWKKALLSRCVRRMFP